MMQSNYETADTARKGIQDGAAGAEPVHPPEKVPGIGAANTASQLSAQLTIRERVL